MEGLILPQPRYQDTFMDSSSMSLLSLTKKSAENNIWCYINTVLAKTTEDIIRKR